MSEAPDSHELEERLVTACRATKLEEVPGDALDTFVREQGFSDAARRVAERWSAHLRIQWLANFLKRPGKRESELLALCYPGCDTENGRMDFARQEIRKLWASTQQGI